MNSESDSRISNQLYYSSVEEKKVQTNPRYKHFTQDIYTAGDEEQFIEKLKSNNKNFTSPKINLEKNIFNNHSFHFSNMYANIDSLDVLNTFRYIFHKFKKGIYVRIKNNKVDVFLPFSKANFNNEWSHKIKIHNSYKNMSNFISYIYSLENRKFDSKYINDYPQMWYANNYLLRYEYPILENDTNIAILKNMLDELCESRQIPDVEFFINKRDFPILKHDNTEPYNHIWDSETHPLVSHSYEKYTPILSMCISNKFADVLMPTSEDWSRVQYKEQKIFTSTSKLILSDTFNIPWSQKINKAVFRGSSTGKGNTIHTNTRLKISYLSTLHSELLDAGITKWNLRPRKFENQKYLQTINIKRLPFGIVPYLSPLEQSSYKYIVNIDGHVSAYRLSLELAMGNVILLVKSNWKLWYSDLLVPYKHYVPIAEDLSDLISQIKWCQNNDSTCKTIAENATLFYNQYLTKNSILDHLQKSLINIKNHCNLLPNNFKSPLDIQILEEHNTIKKLSKIYPDLPFSKIHNIPNMKNQYNILQAIQWNINLHNNRNTFNNSITLSKEIFKNKSSIVNQYKFYKFNIITKEPLNKTKNNENIHETFIGLNCINNLIKYIPNFYFIFGFHTIDKYINIIGEKINGETLLDYIKSSKFNFHEFLFILLQISLALQVAQNYCCFVHNDLTPWNIILKRIPETTIEYKINYNEVISIKTKIIPVIIDYGKAHVIHNNTHYGYVNMYKTSSCQDIITILVTSIHQILSTNKNISYKDLLLLSSFFSDTKYTHYNFKSINSLKKFVYTAHKYTEITFSEKYELEKLKPYDLFLFIKNNFNFNVETSSHYNSIHANITRQVFDFMISNNTPKKIKSYTNTFSKIENFLQNNSRIFDSLDKTLVYYYLQNLESEASTTYTEICNFLTANKINKSYFSLYDSIMKKLETLYNTHITKNNIKIQYDFENNTLLNLYNEELFLAPTKIHNLDINTKTYDVYFFIELLENILLRKSKFSVTEEDRKFYINTYSDILNTDTFILNSNNSLKKTFRKVCYNLYSENISYLSDFKDYPNVLNILELYSNILKKHT